MLALLISLLFLTQSGWADQIYSYMDDTGMRVFTNASGRPSRDESSTLDSPTNRNYLPTIRLVAKRYHISENLIRAIIAVESDYQPLSISSKGCKGLMQLHPDTARRFGVQDVFDPQQNIEGGVKYLNFLMDVFDDDLSRVLAAYNAGESAVIRNGGIPPYPETQNYVHKVTSLYHSYGEGALFEPSHRSKRIYRIDQTNGQVVFTNTPEELTPFSRLDSILWTERLN